MTNGHSRTFKSKVLFNKVLKKNVLQVTTLDKLLYLKSFNI